MFIQKALLIGGVDPETTKLSPNVALVKQGRAANSGIE